MKKIIKPGVPEESEVVCDVTGKPAVAGLVMYFWYGSSHDGDKLKVEMCNEVAEAVLKMLQEKYPQFKVEDDRDNLLPLARSSCISERRNMGSHASHIPLEVIAISC